MLPQFQDDVRHSRQTHKRAIRRTWFDFRLWLRDRGISVRGLAICLFATAFMLGIVCVSSLTIASVQVKHQAEMTKERNRTVVATVKEARGEGNEVDPQAPMAKARARAQELAKKRGGLNRILGEGEAGRLVGVDDNGKGGEERFEAVGRDPRGKPIMNARDRGQKTQVVENAGERVEDERRPADGGGRNGPPKDRPVPDNLEAARQEAKDRVDGLRRAADALQRDRAEALERAREKEIADRKDVDVDNSGNLEGGMPDNEPGLRAPDVGEALEPNFKLPPREPRRPVREPEPVQEKEEEKKEEPQHVAVVEEIAEEGEGMLEKRRNAVKAAFVHAWTGYDTHAFGHDEIRPVTNRTNDSWGGWGVTLVDALDTMLVMGLEDIFAKAREHVAGLNFEKDYSASFFETTIRYLGGMLSAYELSEDEMFLTKAKELADLLVYAFDSPTGIPYHEINMKTHVASNPSWNGKSSVLSELGSVQLEFMYLSHHTKNPSYARKAQKVMDILDTMETPLPGLYPTYIDPETGRANNHLVSFGGLGDSFYEYLLKQYILSGKSVAQYRRMYDASIRGAQAHLVQRSQPSDMVYIAEWDGQLKPKFDHLVCYVPGMLALGAEGETKDEHLELAKELMQTCYSLYERQGSGIGPETVRFDSDLKDFTIESPRYLLRPETIESLFVLYRTTHDDKYREWAWNIFEAIEKHCKVPSGYTGLWDVNDMDTDGDNYNDSMQSFFLAETLKYLYLIFSDDSVLPLSEYVFTTEAHPLGVLRG